MTGHPPRTHPANTSCKGTDGHGVAAALSAAARWLDQHVDRINALNVFPVPDGDTGTNMSLTLRAAVEAVQDPRGLPVSEVLRRAARGALMGARGNSGVILSQLFRGFAGALDQADELRPELFASALRSASEVAYRGVSRPVEGTLLTVARAVAEAAEEHHQFGEEMPALLEHCLRAAEVAVEQTPRQLDVLRRAGVVDAGGEGLRVILEGAWLHVSGRVLHLGDGHQSPRALEQARDSMEDPFGYCTEFVIAHPTATCESIREAMEQLGQSVIVVGDERMIRVHVHALRPGEVLEYAIDRGVLQQIKIENMEAQHAQFVESHSLEEARAEDTQQLGVVAVASGDGLRELFASLGACAVVEGGQTMNPSVQDMHAAVNGASAREVILLPNNPNVIMSAQQLDELADKRVCVVPTRSMPQGIAALLAFNFQDDLENNVRRMAEAAAGVRSLEITSAVRDARTERFDVTRGELIAVLDGEIVAHGKQLESLVLEALRAAGAEECALITLYVGQDVSLANAEALVASLRQEIDGPDWEVVWGGQPHYPYLLALEN